MVILLGSEEYVANSFVLLLAGVPQLVLGPLEMVSASIWFTFYCKSIFFSCETTLIAYQMCPRLFPTWCDQAVKD